MQSKRILLVGGGSIAYEKLEKLLDFTTDITIVSREFSDVVMDKARQWQLKTIEREYRAGDLDGFDIVVVATNTIDIHRQIYLESRDSRVLVNSVDDTRYCDFIFPSYLKQGDLTIAFSTSGASPAFAKHIRRYFQKKIPDGVDLFLQKMKDLRDEIPKGKERMKRFDSMARDFIEKHFK